MGHDIVTFIKDWWEDLKVDMPNKTCIILIPKSLNPQPMDDFRCISLLYKMIFKTLATRLKDFLSNLISMILSLVSL